MIYKRTDLALEMAQMHREKNANISTIDGVEAEEKRNDDIKITRVKITNENGEKALMKPVGTYITIETDELDYKSRETYESVCRALKEELAQVTEVDLTKPVMVVGLGNRRITADALGPKCVEQMLVTRHLFEHMPEVVDEDTASVCAIAPGVLGITGIETLEIVKGVCERVKPGLVIVVDALAARKAERINTTIQISDAGIAPGSGVGNNRKELSKYTLGCDVVAIGVPTVVDALTMANDTLDTTIDEIKKGARGDTGIFKILDKLAPEERYELLKETLAPSMGDMVLTPKEVDLAMDKISKVVANGINIFLQEGMSIGEIESFAL